EDDVTDFLLDCGPYDVESPVDVYAKAQLRLGNRARYGRNGRLVEDDVDALKQRQQGSVVAYVALTEVHIRRVRQIAPVSGDERIDDDDPLAVFALAKGVNERRPDEAGASGYQYVLHA